MKRFLTITLISIIFASCKYKNSVKINQTSDITVENNYLYFKNNIIFNSTLDKLENMNEGERTLWENGLIGFKSLNKNFNENLALDTLHFWSKQYIENLPKNAKVNHCSEIIDSKFMYVKYFFDRSTNKYEEYLNEETTNEEYLLQKNISIENYSYLVNSNGVVRIGNTFYQFKHNYTKSIEPANATNLDKLINTKPKDSNKNNDVKFSTPGQILVVGKVGSCLLPSYYYDNAWGIQNLIEWSSSPQLKLVITGGYRNSNDLYCQALYTPIVNAYADTYKKSWFNVQWLQVLTDKTLEVSYTVNNPAGATPNEYSYLNQSNIWRINYSKSFPALNSQTYSYMFNITNFYARSTSNGGPSGGAVTITR